MNPVARGPQPSVTNKADHPVLVADEEDAKHNHNEEATQVTDKTKGIPFLQKIYKLGRSVVGSIWNRQSRSQCASHAWPCKDSDHFETPDWTSGVLSPWIKRSTRMEGTNQPTIYLGLYSQGTVAKFWKNRRYDVYHKNVDVFDVSKRPDGKNRNRPTVFVSTLPSSVEVAAKVCREVLPHYDKFTVLANADTIARGYMKELSGLQLIYITRPVRFVRTSNEGRIVPFETAHPSNSCGSQKACNCPPTTCGPGAQILCVQAAALLAGNTTAIA